MGAVYHKILFIIFLSVSKLFSIAAWCDILQNKSQCMELHPTHDSNTECRSVFLVAFFRDCKQNRLYGPFFVMSGRGCRVREKCRPVRRTGLSAA